MNPGRISGLEGFQLLAEQIKRWENGSRVGYNNYAHSHLF